MRSCCRIHQDKVIPVFIATLIRISISIKPTLMNHLARMAAVLLLLVFWSYFCLIFFVECILAITVKLSFYYRYITGTHPDMKPKPYDCKA